MRRSACILRSCAIVLLLSVASSPSAFAAFVWSPQTGWVGPSGAVKDTPEEQLAFATALFERHDYKRAVKEFKKLLRAYKASREAAEAQYYLGRCREEENDYYKAFLEYRKTLKTYPSTRRVDEILEREYRIGNYFLSGNKRKLFGAAAILPARDKAVEIFQAIVDDGPFGEYGQLAQYKLGLAHLALEEYEPAVAAFEQLLSRYPDSPLVDDAHFQIAQASLKGTFQASYDQSPTDLAIRELDTFMKDFPDSPLAKDAARRLEGLKERRAQHEYEVGQFYERRHHPESARTYYEAIVDRFSQSPWAQKAVARLQILSPSRP